VTSVLGRKRYMREKTRLLKRIGELIAGSVLTLAVLISGICFTYAAFRSSAKLTRYQGIVEQTKLVGKGRKWFVFTLRGLPFGLSVFRADQDYRTLVASLAPTDTVVAYYNGPYPALGGPASATKEVWHLTKGHQDLISLPDKQATDKALGFFSLLLGLGMAWGTAVAFRKA
jgi:hypothetical protein